MTTPRKPPKPRVPTIRNLAAKGLKVRQGAGAGAHQAKTDYVRKPKHRRDEGKDEG
jgi:hypothetical protein